MHADCCYDRGEQDGPSANLTNPNVLESCLSLRHGFLKILIIRENIFLINHAPQPMQNGLRIGGTRLVKLFSPKHYRTPSHSLHSLDQPGHY